MELQKLREELDTLTHKINALHPAKEASAPSPLILHLRYELANALTHGVGLVLFLAAIPYLIAYSTIHSSQEYTICTVLFGFGLLMTYASSTLYHSLHHAESKSIMRIFDHVSIFLLIGGSYTPVVYHYLPYESAIPFLEGLWALLIAGSVFKIFFTGRYKYISVALYVILGWLVVFIAKPIITNMSTATFYLLVAEAFFYTGGVAFYVWKSLKYHHAVWHIFVLGGSICQYFIVLNSATSP